MNKISLWKSYGSMEGIIFRILQPTLKKKKRTPMIWKIKLFEIYLFMIPRAPSVTHVIHS